MKKVSWVVVIAGAVVGLAAVVLTHLGNPANMGFCIACFLIPTEITVISYDICGKLQKSAIELIVCISFQPCVVLLAGKLIKFLV